MEQVINKDLLNAECVKCLRFEFNICNGRKYSAIPCLGYKQVKEKEDKSNE